MSQSTDGHVQNESLHSDFHFPSHYAYTKYCAERDAIAATKQGLVVCALRLPGIYGVDMDGVGDPLIVEPLLSGAHTDVPSADNLSVDFCYVENAAAAHLAGVKALLERPLEVCSIGMV